MSDTVIKIDNLSKLYRLGQVGTGTLSHDLNRWWAKVRGKEDPFAKVGQVNDRTKQAESDYVWALKDINLEIERGDVVGIIGSNGAGKSTLLKLISRITSPTTGEIKAKGRIASLLEVGTGMHPEMTARENIFLNGAILGMRRREIARKFDDIVDFTGCAMYVDTPVKRYSSGMRVRLAFAVAAFLEPDILIVDEVLAVGDAKFQKQAICKMKDVSTSKERTVLFVSHNMRAIQSLCKRVIWIEQGKILESGDLKTVTHYVQRGTNALLEQKWDTPATAPGNENVRVHSARITPLNQSPDELITVKTALQLEFAFWNFLPEVPLTMAATLKTLEGLIVFGVGSPEQNFPRGLISGNFTIPANFLNDGTYTIRFHVTKDRSTILYAQNDILIFEVNDVKRGNWYGKKPGVVRPQFDWQVQWKNAD